MTLPGQVLIYGASDDLIEIEGDAKGCDEYPGEDGAFVLIGPEGTVRIRVRYVRGGLWSIEASPVEEDKPMLAVHMSGHERGYSAQAIVHGVDLVIAERGTEE